MQKILPLPCPEFLPYAAVCMTCTFLLIWCGWAGPPRKKHCQHNCRAQDVSLDPGTTLTIGHQQYGRKRGGKRRQGGAGEEKGRGGKDPAHRRRMTTVAKNAKVQPSITNRCPCMPVCPYARMRIRQLARKLNESILSYSLAAACLANRVVWDYIPSCISTSVFGRLICRGEQHL